MNVLLFDAHGVLYHRERRHAHLHPFLERHGLPAREAGEVRRATAAIHARAMVGAVSRKALYEAMLVAYGLADGGVAGDVARMQEEGCAALAVDDADITLYAAVAETLHELRRRGYKLGVVTDSVSSTAEKLRWLRSCGLHIAWDAFVNSCEVGVRKPDPRIYQAALAACGALPSEALFVGHKASELEGARAVGMATAAVYRDAGAGADNYLDAFHGLLGVV